MSKQRHSKTQYNKIIQRTTKLLKQAIQTGQLKEYKMTDAEMKELWENDDEWQLLQTKNGMQLSIPFSINYKNSLIKHCFCQTTTAGCNGIPPVFILLYHSHQLSQLENLVHFSSFVDFL